MEKRTCAVVGIVALLVAGALPATVGAATYEITSPNAVDTPDRTVSVGGSSFEVSEAARISQGETLVLDVEAPSSATYDVELRDSDRQFVDDAEGSGDDTIRFSTGSLGPGTYVATVFDDGSVQALLPVVVKGYSVDEEIPDTAEAGQTFEVSATLTEETSAPDPSAVQIALAEADSEEIVLQESLSADGSLTYSGSVSVDSAGEYNAYVFVRGSDEISGERVFLGLSDPTTMSVTEAEETPTPTATPTEAPADGGSGGGGGGGGGGGVAPADTETPTPTPTATPTPTPTPTATPTPTPTPTATPTPTPTDAASGGSDDTATPTGTPGSAATQEATEQTTTSTRLPVGALPVLFTLLLAGGLAARSRR
jgi:hypothetical protein